MRLPRPVHLPQLTISPARFLLFLLGTLTAAHGQVERRPNFVFIIGDDISAEDLGCYGNPGIRTPNIDRLAEQGLRFTNAYLTASSCSPSRCSIITDRYPHNLETAADLHGELPTGNPETAPIISRV